METLDIEIRNNGQEAEETQVSGVEKRWGLEKAEQKRGYEVERVIITGRGNECTVFLPAWLVGKPTQELSVEMSVYICLGKQEIQSIRSRVLIITIYHKIISANLRRILHRGKKMEW